jgi:hypothetical protein
MCQIDEHAREESRFGDSQEKPDDVELHGCRHKCGSCSHNPPGYHDSTDPLSCTPAFYDDGAWNLQKKVPKKKNTSSESEYPTIEEWQILSHGQLGNCNVRSVYIRDDVANKQERK